MEILIEYRDRKWSITPNPAKVTVGEQVTWLLSWPESSTHLARWTIYFGPFRELDLHTSTQLVPTVAVEEGGGWTELGKSHSGAVGPFVAEEAGEYKYGVKLSNAENGEHIDEEDPKLIVRPRSER